MNFSIALARVLKSEGGFVDHPADPGGATRYGVTQRVARANGYQGDMRDFPLSMAGPIYKAQYWDPMLADQLPAAVAFQAFDAAVNHGVSQASKFLQRAVGATPDGVIGPRTLAAVSAFTPATVVIFFNAERLAFYTGLPTWEAFGRGWTNRVAENLRYAAEDA